jgi:hypothetical protein
MDVTLVVRVSVGDTGILRGVVERVKTCEKERFVGAETLGAIVERMARDGTSGRRSKARPRRAAP